MPYSLSLLISILLIFLIPVIPIYSNQEMPGLLDNFWENLGDAHWGWNLAWHLGAVGSTIFFVNSGTDKEVKNYFQRENPIGQGMADWALIYGNFWHLVPSFIFYWHGKATEDRRMAGAGAAGLQAIFSTFLVNSAQKIMSGRRGPGHGSGQSSFIHSDTVVGSGDPSDFSLDFWNNPVENFRFFWPSGHTSTAFAFAAAMTAYYPEKTWVPLVTYPLAAFMGVLMIEGDFHWFSDVVAGAMIGQAIGWTIGKRYLNWYLGKKNVRDKGVKLSLAPVFSPESKGIALSLEF